MPFSLSPGVFCFSELSFITEPSDVTVIPKDPAILDCQAHGQPPVTIKWLKNGVRLAESKHIQFLPNGSLYIPKVKHNKEDSDEGFYQCLSQNKYGAILSQRSRLTIASEYGAQGTRNFSRACMRFNPYFLHRWNSQDQDGFELIGDICFIMSTCKHQLAGSWVINL